MKKYDVICQDRLGIDVRKALSHTTHALFLVDTLGAAGGSGSGVHPKHSAG